MKKILCILFCCVMIIGILPTVAFAEGTTPVTLDLSNGEIDITPTGYSQGSATETPYTGAYIITGSRTCDTPLDIINNTGGEVTFDITLKDAEIIAPDWCTVIRIGGNSKIVLNLQIQGNCKVESHNHPVFRSINTANVAVNIFTADGAALELNRRDSRNVPLIYGDRNDSDGSISATLNGRPIDNNHNFSSNTSAIYTITFDANGSGEILGSSVTGADGKLASMPTPTRTGYRFIGWYTEAVGGEVVEADNVFDANTTIYAHWKKIVSDSSAGSTIDPTTMESAKTADAGIVLYVGLALLSLIGITGMVFLCRRGHGK